MKLVARYLIWYVEEGLLSDDESYPHQRIETVIIPSMDGTIDELRAIFKTKLDKKYGQGKWEFEYYLGVAQLSDEEIIKML